MWIHYTLQYSSLPRSPKRPWRADVGILLEEIWPPCRAASSLRGSSKVPSAATGTAILAPSSVAYPIPAQQSPPARPLDKCMLRLVLLAMMENAGICYVVDSFSATPGQ